MNVAHRTLTAVLAILAVAALGWAQQSPSQDDVLQRYQLAIDNLNAAVQALPEDGVTARDELDRALSALRTLSRGSNASFVESLDRVFDRARTAVENRSRTDLAVQAHVLRGGFQRLLYESALQSAVEGDVELARQRLLRLTSDIGLGEARASQVQQVEDVGALRRILEAGTAEQVAARLTGLAEAGAPADRDATYATLAAAYGDYLIVQDSPRLAPSTNQRFVEAANALVDESSESYLAAVRELANELDALARSADEALAGPDQGAAEAPADGQEAVGQEAAETPGAGEPGDGAPAGEGAAEATSEAAALALTQEEAPAAPDGEPPLEAQEAGAEGEAADAAPVEPGVRERIEAELAAEREERAVAALDGDLAAVGVAAGQREALIERLRSLDIERLADVERELAATADRFTSAVHRGELPRARSLLEQLHARYGEALAPVVRTVAADVDLRTDRLLRRLSGAPQLRVQDAALLASQLDAVSQRLGVARPPASHDAIRAVADAWGGLPRAVLMIVLALFAFVPLRYLNLAFGGGNRNWRLVGSALFLLLVPVIFEGIAAAAALLAEPVDMPVLATLTTWSVFQNDLTQVAWAALMLLALVMATRGFYGICVQFGVIGRKRTRDTATDTKVSNDETLVDWDEEF